MKRIIFIVLMAVGMGLQGQTFDYDTIYPMKKDEKEWSHTEDKIQLFLAGQPIRDILRDIKKEKDSLFIFTYEHNDDRLKNTTIIGFKENNEWMVTKLEVYFYPQDTNDINSDGLWVWRKYIPVIVMPNWTTPIETLYSNAYVYVLTPLVLYSYRGILPYNTIVYFGCADKELCQIYNCTPNQMYGKHMPLYHLLSYFIIGSSYSDNYEIIYSYIGRNR